MTFKIITGRIVGGSDTCLEDLQEKVNNFCTTNSDCKVTWLQSSEEGKVQLTAVVEYTAQPKKSIEDV